MTTYTRPVLLLLCGLLLLTLAIAVLNTLVPLWLAHENLPTWQVGMVSSSFFTGNLLGTLLTGSLIKRFGFNRSYYLASLIFAVGCAGLGLMVGFWSWMVWRFIAGVGCAMIWVVVESALMCSGTSRNRGRLLAAYMMVYYVGTVLGQLMVSKLPTDLMSVLPWVTGMVLAAILPLLFTRIVNQNSEHQEATHVWPMLRLRQARLGVNGCIISGIVLGSLYGLMPLYLNHQGVSDSGIGFWMAVMVSAGIVGQWPIAAWRTALVVCWCCAFRSSWSSWAVSPCSATPRWRPRCSFWGLRALRSIRSRWRGPVRKLSITSWWR